MFAATSPSEPPIVVRGRAEARFSGADGTTRLGHLDQGDPLRILFPRALDPAATVAVIANTGGGLVGGDRLDMAFAAQDGARVLVTSQAAEKAYRSAGATCAVDVRLSVGAGAWLEWLPHETIVFDGARLRRRLALECAKDGRLMAGEMMVFGRRARGERLAGGLVREAWEVRREGRLIWADALHLEGDLAAALADPFAFGGAAALATLLYCGPDAVDRLERAREGLPANGDGLKVGATLVNGVLLVRWLDADAARLRAAFGAFWAYFRHAAGAGEARLPRLWHI
jgi:urease accessory protein